MEEGHNESDAPSLDDSSQQSSEDEFLNEEEEELQEQVADLPFEDLQKARSDGSSSFFSISKKQPQLKRANKNRPVEMSSKKPVGRFREVIQAPKQIFRDPRFETLCGNYDESKFKKAYSFLYDEELPAERKKLQKLLETEKAPEATDEVKKHLSWIDRQLRNEERRRKQSIKLMELRRKEKDAIRHGKKPFYLKKSTLKKQELLEKYQELKDSGKLEEFLAKRRRKNAAKDHRYVPYRRPSTQ